MDGTGRRNENVTDFRYALVECDNMELGKQQAIIRQLELPCAALVYRRQERPRHRQGGCPGLCRVPQARGLPLRRLPEKRPTIDQQKSQPFPPFLSNTCN